MQNSGIKVLLSEIQHGAKRELNVAIRETDLGWGNFRLWVGRKTGFQIDTK